MHLRKEWECKIIAALFGLWKTIYSLFEMTDIHDFFSRNYSGKFLINYLCNEIHIHWSNIEYRHNHSICNSKVYLVRKFLYPPNI